MILTNSDNNYTNSPDPPKSHPITASLIISPSPTARLLSMMIGSVFIFSLYFYNIHHIHFLRAILFVGSINDILRISYTFHQYRLCNMVYNLCVL